MKLMLNSLISFKIRYTYMRGNSAIYQRKIPIDLTARYGGAIHIKQNLRTRDPAAIAMQAEALNRYYDTAWATMRLDPSITPETLRADDAVTLISSHAAHHSPSMQSPPIDSLIASLITKAQAHPQTLPGPPGLTLNEALELYLKIHPKALNGTFVTYTRRTWLKLVRFLGDKQLVDVTRDEANAFVRHELEAGAKTTTVKRVLSTVKAVFNLAIVEKSLSTPNPFNKLLIPGLGEDTEEREPFDISELITLATESQRLDDDIRWLLALLIDQGGRLAEFVGLELSDFHLDTPIPFVRIEKKPWRSLKTSGSTRDVPLVGISLWAAQRITATASKQQRFAFPRYTDGKTCKATSASATLNDWIASQGIEKTTHSFRHSMRDRLRQVNAPKDIQDAVGGWGKQTIADNYGHGYALQTMQEWLKKVALTL